MKFKSRDISIMVRCFTLHLLNFCVTMSFPNQVASIAILFSISVAFLLCVAVANKVFILGIVFIFNLSNFKVVVNFLTRLLILAVNFLTRLLILGIFLSTTLIFLRHFLSESYFLLVSNPLVFSILVSIALELVTSISWTVF